MILDASFWLQMGGLLFLETTLLAAAGWIAARRARNPRTRANIWQAVFLALLATLLARGSGLSVGGADRAPSLREIRVSESPAPEGSFDPILSTEFHSDSASTSNIRWPGWLWAAGTALLLGRMGAGHWALRRARRRARPASAETLLSIDELRRAIQVPRTSAVVWNVLPCPSAFGLFRPTIALPEGLELRIPSEQFKAVLAHELAHIAARDPFWALVSESVRALLWWNPAAWLARRELMHASELAADQASACVPNGPNALAESLVALGLQFYASPAPSLPVLGGEGLRSCLGRRVKSLLANPPRWKPVRPLRAWLLRGSLMAAVLLLAALLPHAQSPGPWWVLMQGPVEKPASMPQQSSSNLATISGIMTDPQFRQVIDALNSAEENAPNAKPAPADPTAADAAPPTSAPPEKPTVPVIDDIPFLGRLFRPSNPANAEPVQIESAPSLTLRFEIAEIAETRAGLGLDWLFGDFHTKQPVAIAQQHPVQLPGNDPIKGRNIQVEHLRFEEQFAVLGAGQYSGLKSALERQEGVDFLSAPKVTTSSGRQAQISVLDVHTIITGQSEIQSGTNIVGVENISCGQVVNVTPVAVGERWQLPVVASTIEFLGYDSNMRAQVRVRDAAATAMVGLGETLLIRGVPVTETRKVKGGLFRRDRTEEVRKRLYIFVTPERPK